MTIGSTILGGRGRGRRYEQRQGTRSSSIPKQGGWKEGTHGLLQESPNPRRKEETESEMIGNQREEGKIIKIIYLNTRSLVNKLNELEILLNEQKPDLVLICETWCNDETTLAMLNIVCRGWQ